jgi:hypothetical protein
VASERRVNLRRLRWLILNTPRPIGLNSDKRSPLASDLERLAKTNSFALYELFEAAGVNFFDHWAW